MAMRLKKWHRMNAFWEALDKRIHIRRHDFDESPLLYISRKEIREFPEIDRLLRGEAGLLCEHGREEEQPQLFEEKGLFILAVDGNEQYVVAQGMGHFELPNIPSDEAREHQSVLDFELETLRGGRSALQHLYYAFATGLLQHFVGDSKIVHRFSGCTIKADGLQLDVPSAPRGSMLELKKVRVPLDGVYEGREKVVVVATDGGGATNFLGSRLLYPSALFQEETGKEIVPLFLQKRGDLYCLWQFFIGLKPRGYSCRYSMETTEYEAIVCVRKGAFRIVGP